MFNDLCAKYVTEKNDPVSILLAIQKTIFELN